jgi:hypothetical protein
VQTPYLSFEFPSGLFDSGAFIWRLPYGKLQSEPAGAGD